MKYKYLIFCFIVFLNSACAPDELTEEQKAQIHLQKTDSLYKLNQLNAAKMQIDTINDIYRKQVAIREKANTILSKIKLIEHKKNLIYADSLIKIKQVELDSITKNFRFEKDAKYQSVGNYIYKNQQSENKTTSTFIKAYVDETGIFYLSSYYSSTVPLKHSSAKFSIDDVFTETEKVTKDGFNYSFTDEGKTFERVIYKSAANNNIGALVQQNSGKTIVITLQGEKRDYKFHLSNQDKKAISESYNLSIILSDLKNLHKISKISKKKIIFLEANSVTKK